MNPKCPCCNEEMQEVSDEEAEKIKDVAYSLIDLFKKDNIKPPFALAAMQIVVQFIEEETGHKVKMEVLPNPVVRRPIYE